MVAFIYQHILVEPYPIECILVMGLAGLSIVGAFILFNLALISGKGALAMAISQTQSFFWLIFDMVFNQRMPHGYEAIAMAIGVAGASVIIFAKK